MNVSDIYPSYPRIKSEVKNTPGKDINGLGGMYYVVVGKVVTFNDPHNGNKGKGVLYGRRWHFNWLVKSNEDFL